MMDIHSNNREIDTSLSYKHISFCKTEDSGYHTSFTSPSLECTSLSNDNSIVLSNYCKIQVDCYPITPGNDLRPLGVRYNCLNATSGDENTPYSKRGIKRPYEEDVSQNEISFDVATPTSLIAREVQKLHVNDTIVNSTSSCESGKLGSIINDIYYKNYLDSAVNHPTTPIKKICRSSCNLSPFNHRRSARKVDFAIHSLSCEKQALKLQPNVQPKEPKPIYSFKPNQKVDVIHLLYSHEDYCSSSIRKILSYLSQEDIYNFTLVSPTWCNIFKRTNTKDNYNDFFNNVKSNLENWDHGETPKIGIKNLVKPLKELQNVNLAQSTPRSPAKSPRTTRFNKFTKAASLDSRSQLTCFKCRHPAKVTVEVTGEEWVECTSATCSHQYCRLCKSMRHPGKSCIQYDLIDGPSPSKRRKNVCPVSSNKSKKKLKRLLF